MRHDAVAEAVGNERKNERVILARVATTGYKVALGELLMHRVTNDSPDSTRNVPLQRRHARRTPSTDLVEVLAPRQAVGVCLNVSEGGIRVAVDGALSPDETCQVRLRLPTGPVMQTFRVVWSREVTDGWIAGLARIASH